MTKPKTHFEDIRLANNAGMSFPVCKTTGPGHIDLDMGRLQTTPHFRDVTCVHCRRIAPRRYPWASWAKR